MGVTPSPIARIESSLIYPAPPARLKPAQVNRPGLAEAGILAKLRTPRLLGIPPEKSPFSHLVVRTGEELGNLLKGKLPLKMKNSTDTLRSGERTHLTRDIPTQWKNPLPGPAELLRIKSN